MFAIIFSGSLVLAAAPPSAGAQDRTIIIQESHRAPETAVHEIPAFPYTHGDATGVEFQGTHRSPEANGEAKVEWKDGMSEIEIELDEMKPAQLFGGDFNTYILWAASPEGQVENLGEFILDGNRSKLNVSTRMDTFGMFVTAEPHFMVDHPSRFIVLENVELKEDVEGVPQAAEIRFAPYEGHYDFDRESLADAEEADGEVHTVLDQAATAVELAREAGAEVFAPAELAEAEAALNQASGAVESADDLDDEDVDRLARQAVRKADHAQDVALETAFEEALSAERAARAADIAVLESELAEARSEAERARIRERQAQLELEIERAALAAALRAEARRESSALEESEKGVDVEAGRAKPSPPAAAGRDDALDRLAASLGDSTTIHRTERGLIVLVPDALFEPGTADLSARGRRELGGIARAISSSGVDLTIRLDPHMVHEDPDLWLNREETVRDHLLTAGVPPEALDASDGRFGHEASPSGAIHIMIEPRQ